MSTLKGLPGGIQSFEKLISNDYLYIDKTKQIYELAKQNNPLFISRPRRFGKSLMCSTLEALFTGKKELFKGLWIENSDWTWEKHPVLHFDFSSIARSTPEELKNSIAWNLDIIGEENKIDTSNAPTIVDKLKLLIPKLALKNKVVLLVDEYDEPIIDYLTEPEVAIQMRKILKSFYKTIKSLDKYFRLIFITGVSKFSKTSIFSGVNNLKDLSLDNRTATMFGYTQQELEFYFKDYFDLACRKTKLSQKDLLEKIKTWYNGYRFFSVHSTPDDSPTEITETVYNPLSILSFFDINFFKNFWFTTGSPTFLIDLIKQKNYPLIDLEQVTLNEINFESFDIENINLKTLLFQTGYLTITDYHPESSNYTLEAPNFEVQQAMTQYIVESMTTMDIAKQSDFVYKLKQAFAKNNIDEFVQILQQFFAGIPYNVQIKKEKYYQSIFLVTMRLVGFNVDVEVATNIGRIDAVMEKEDRIYIIEFKIDKTAELAIEQIKSRKYYQKYMATGKPIEIVGINFDSEKRNIDPDWIVRKV